MAAIEAASGRIDTSTIRPYAEVKKGYTHFRNGDILFAKITPCMENGKMAVAHGLRNGVGLGSTEFHVLRPREGTDPHYVYHFVSSGRYRSDAAHHMTGAVGQRRVPISFLENSKIPLPDVDEQRRIVAEIEKQFSRLDEAVACLKRVKAKLKRYKAAVLKAAVEGRLVPTSSEWRTVKLSDVANVVDPHPSHRTPSTFPDGVPYIGIGDFTVDGDAARKSARKVSPTVLEEHHARYRLREGDFIFGKIGTLGRPVSLKAPFDYALSANVVLIQPDNSKMHSSFALAYMASPLMSSLLSREARATTQAAFGIKRVRDLHVPLPSIDEQHSIVAEVDRRLSIAREVEAEVEANLKRAQVLRQAVLSKSFQVSPS